uniref:Uncharacterized protein n=1 Tax=Gasterosteus aculeatus TaxID=69293 RepID=G3PNM0_GASAC
MPEKIWERRLRVAASSKQDPCLSGTAPKASTSAHLPRASSSWADMMDAESPEMPPLFEQLLELEPGGEDAEGDPNSDLLDVDDMEEEEDDSTFPVEPPKPPSASDVVPPVDNNLYEVCKRAASKLGILQWPAAQDATGVEIDLYDGKRLPPTLPPSKQLLPCPPEVEPSVAYHLHPNCRSLSASSNI